MNTVKLKVTAIAVALLAFVTIVVRQQWRTQRLLAEAAVLRAQVEQAVAVKEANRRLTGQLQAASDRYQEDLSELLRLRGQSARMRQTEQENARLRAEVEAQAAAAAQLWSWLATATQHLARTESALADVVKLSPEELRQLKEEALSVGCVNNLKRIGLAARVWANDHQNVFPPDFISMQYELATPMILFCPADAAAIRVTEWSQLDPSSITYRFLNPNGNDSDPAQQLTTCPIHGHIGLSDGSVHRQ